MRGRWKKVSGIVCVNSACEIRAFELHSMNKNELCVLCIVL